MTIPDCKVLAKVLVINAQHQVLVLRRSQADHNGPGMWDLPGGTVEERESHNVGACRELIEETGLTAQESELSLFYVKSGEYGNGPRCWLFYCYQPNGDYKITLSDEHDTYEWLSIPDAATRDMFQVQQEAIVHLRQLTGE